MSSTTSDRPKVDEEAFREWLTAVRPNLNAAWKHQNGQWFCLLEQYDITGAGPDEEAAFHDALGLLGVYLCSCFMDGQPAEDAVRPIPLQLRLEIRRDVLFAKLVDGLAKRTPRASESLVFIERDRIAANAC